MKIHKDTFFSIFLLLFFSNTAYTMFPNIHQRKKPFVAPTEQVVVPSPRPLDSLLSPRQTSNKNLQEFYLEEHGILGKEDVRMFFQNSSIDGLGHTLDLGEGSLIVGINTKLILRDITIIIKNQDNLLMFSDTSKLVLENATIALLADYNFNKGSLIAKSGTSTITTIKSMHTTDDDRSDLRDFARFTYSSEQISMICHNATLRFYSIGFHYQPKSNTLDNLQFQHTTAMLLFDNAIFRFHNILLKSGKVKILGKTLIEGLTSRELLALQDNLFYNPRGILKMQNFVLAKKGAAIMHLSVHAQTRNVRAQERFYRTKSLERLEGIYDRIANFNGLPALLD